jgi:hypothetical protein
MFKKMFHTFLAFVLGLVVCFYASLQEYAHTFEHHHETIDHIHNDGDNCGRDASGLAFEQYHHHCDYLTQMLPHFIKAETSYHFDIWEVKRYVSYLERTYNVWFDNEHYSFRLRGPPALA